MNHVKRTSSARERILETAKRLFYAEGVRAVGIDRIIAEAGVAKMTLYKHFRSKDELILEVLKLRDREIMEFFRARMAAHAEQGLGGLETFFTALKEWLAGPDFRGCLFINTAVEMADRAHAASRYVSEHKDRVHDLLRELVAEASGPAGRAQVQAICVLVEGAIVMAQMQGDPQVADVAKDAALALIGNEEGR